MDKNSAIDLIERYLNNELSPEEKLDFEQLSQDEEFATEFGRRQMAHKIMHHAIVKDLRVQLRSLEEADRVVMIRKRRRQRLLLWSAAASVLLVAVFYFLLQPRQKSGAELAQAYYRLPDYAIRSGAPEEGALSRGMNALRRGAYSEAAAALDSIADSDPYYVAATYFEAHAFYLSKQYESAEASFDEVIVTKDPRYLEEAEWYALLSCLARNSDCGQRLERLAGDQTHPYHEQALELVGKLED